MALQFPTIEPMIAASSAEWKDWKWQQRGVLRWAKWLTNRLNESEKAALDLTKTSFISGLTPYYSQLIDWTEEADPIRRSILPSSEEMKDGGQQVEDPLGERDHSPTPRIIHRYPDRVLFLVTDQCGVYCRYCLRKHFTGQGQSFIKKSDYELGLDYIRNSPGVREVLISGGDPLTLSDEKLDKVLGDLRNIQHIEIIRIGTRMPVVNPMRLTEELIRILKAHQPVFIMSHFNHPNELTQDSADGLIRFADHGISVWNQMVLLNGVNNHPALVQALSRRLLYLRVKPYYMFQCDPSKGSEHFKTSIDESVDILRELWGRMSGMAVPKLSLDIPRGGGKVGLLPGFHHGFQPKTSQRKVNFHGWDGKVGEYENPKAEQFIEPLVHPQYAEEWKRICNQSYGSIGDR